MLDNCSQTDVHVIMSQRMSGCMPTLSNLTGVCVCITEDAIQFKAMGTRINCSAGQA